MVVVKIMSKSAGSSVVLRLHCLSELTGPGGGGLAGGYYMNTTWGKEYDLHRCSKPLPLKFWARPPRMRKAVFTVLYTNIVTFMIPCCELAACSCGKGFWEFPKMGALNLVA